MLGTLSSNRMEVEELNKENDPQSQVSLVAKVLKFAKLDLSTLNSNVQQVFLAEPLETEELKLLELNPVVTDFLENGGKLIVKGNASENCVACTEDQTFELKDTEISNSLLLVPGVAIGGSGAGCEVEDDDLSLTDCYVKSICHSYLELRPLRPKVNVLLSLLQPSLYEGPENEENVTNKLTLHDLLTRVLASDEEIKSALSQLRTVEMDGFIRLVDFDYLSRVVGSVKSLIEENSWGFDNFSRGETLRTLQELYPRELIEYVLASYGSSRSGSSADGDEWCLNEDKICKFIAEMLLRPTTKFSLTDFLHAWKESVPEGMVTNLSQLNGMCFVDSTNADMPVITYFPVEQLSEDVKTRFEQLFQMKSTWTLEEITPYVEPLCIGKLTVSVLIMKNARAFTKGGVKYYTSKYMKN